MFEICSKSKKKTFVVSKEFVKEILERRTQKENQEEISEITPTFEENNLGNQKVKRK